ncbi:MAG: hypothetical protein PHG52_02820 [Synergistaceae bacterium]|jgi:hypothetical protein|nr:hypothetical protein [Synergistaceae bacterium]MDD4704705.1 hypothetical protein [Synergistaceae bacterium]
MSENTLYKQIKDEMKENEEALTTVFEQTLKCIALIDRVTGNKLEKVPKSLNSRSRTVEKNV